MTISEELLKAQETGSVIRVYCTDRTDGWVDGFVVGVGSEFFALEIIEANSRLNGINCMRFEDITDTKMPTPHHAFVQKALRLKNITRSEDPNLDLSSRQSLLNSGRSSFPITTIHLQHDDGEYSDVCYIGKVVSLSDTEVTVACINPDAEWSDDETFPLDLIYRVDYDGEYENTLLMVVADTG